jgi:hypothetical protein
MIQRATDASLVQSLGVQPILVQGIGRNPKQWEGRVYFDLEDPEQPTVRLRSWISGKRAPQWNQVLSLTVLIRAKIKKPGVMFEPELEVVGIQESGQVASSRDELRKKFIAAIHAKKLVVADVFLKEMPKVLLVTNQGGEADRDIQSQLAGYRDLLAWGDPIRPDDGTAERGDGLEGSVGESRTGGLGGLGSWRRRRDCGLRS